MGIKIKNFPALALCIFVAGCAAQNEPKAKAYVLMEKQIADIPSGSRGLQSANVRKRTTAKVVIASEAKQSHNEVEEAMKQALQDIRNDDTELDAVLVWAYKNRSELNNTFTLGKLEWSKDKKGWDLSASQTRQAGGKQNLTDEITIEIRK